MFVNQSTPNKSLVNSNFNIMQSTIRNIFVSDNIYFCIFNYINYSLYCDYIYHHLIIGNYKYYNSDVVTHKHLMKIFNIIITSLKVHTFSFFKPFWIVFIFCYKTSFYQISFLHLICWNRNHHVPCLPISSNFLH